jgi:acyl-ACP thioesterase
LERKQKVKVWADQYEIHAYLVDTKARAGLPVLCHMMQESAWKHAENLELGYEALLNDNLVWILARQLIEIDVYPRWGDTITVETWATGQERLYWYRDFKILDTDHNLLGKGSTAWFVIDLETRKPQRADRLNYTLPDEFERMFSTRPGKIPRLQPSEPVFSVQAGYRHLDVNRHVNNVKYLQWLLEGFDLTFHETHNLHTFEVNYLNEGNFGDNIVAVQQPLSELSFLHSLQHKENGAEICRARTVWQPIEEK